MIVTVSAVAATCTKTGLTEGKQCKNCDYVSVKQETSILIDLMRDIRTDFMYNDALEAGGSEEDAQWWVDEYKHLTVACFLIQSPTATIDHASIL